jgi:concentrative nucleoside transporter, CNT family
MEHPRPRIEITITNCNSYFVTNPKRVMGLIKKDLICVTTFGFYIDSTGELPFAETGPGSTFVLAFRALPLILVVSALSSLLFYWRVLPLIVKTVSRVLQRILGIGGAVGLSAAADIFVGMMQRPRHYPPDPLLARWTR